MHISIFNVRILNRIGQLPELTASAVDHNVDIVCVQEHRYYHCEIDIKYHDTGDGWMFISAFACKNSVNALVGGVGMLIGPRALKSLDSIEKIQPATFNGNICTTIVCYSPTNASDETELDTF